MHNLDYNPFLLLYYDFHIDYEKIRKQIQINFLFDRPKIQENENSISSSQ
jgi:hypothetical protein